MVFAEVDFDADILNRIAGDDPLLEPLEKAFFNRGHEVAGDRAAHHGIDPQKIVLARDSASILRCGKSFLGGELFRIGPFGEGINPRVDLGELPRPARLLLVAVASLGVGLHRFAIGDFGFLGFDFDMIAPLEPFANHA